jgi:hypothetical protein
MTKGRMALPLESDVGAVEEGWGAILRILKNPGTARNARQNATVPFVIPSEAEGPAVLSQ